MTKRIKYGIYLYKNERGCELMNIIQEALKESLLMSEEENILIDKLSQERPYQCTQEAACAYFMLGKIYGRNSRG